jgi:capsid protein
MKMFHDLNELLDAELVSNIVTAAFSLFIKLNPGANPWDEAMARSTWQFPTDGVSNTQPPPPTRYEGFEPGKIYYGNVGEEMQPIKGDRPGNTFEAFTRLIKKAIALSAGLPYAVAFADTDGISFAGYRSAMLEAWRTFTFHRAVLANQDCQTIWAMLQEESYLRGEYDLPNFYTNFSEATRCVWRGAPKGDIEPIKAAQADILLIQNNLKTREEAVMERGGELEPTFDKLAAEQEEMTKLGLYDGPVLAVPGESKQQAGAAEGDAAGASGVGSVGQPAGPAPPGVTKGPASAKPAAPAAAPETEDARLIMAYLRTLSVRIEEIHDNVETMRQEAAV